MKQSNKQVKRNQEDKERARQVDGILHNVIQSVSVSRLLVLPYNTFPP